MPTRHKYALGAVKPHVRAAANEIGNAFDVTNVYGFSVRNIAGTSTLSDHALGLADDFMVYTDTAKGQAIADYVQANAARLAVTYIMWQQQIWSVERAGEGWRPVEDRGSATANHMDHVHVSFTSSGKGATSSGVQTVGWDGGAVGSLLGASEFIAFATSGNTWIRAGLFVAGAVLLLIALGALGKVTDAAMGAAKSVRKVKR